ncbi:MAG: hypothetical protein SP4CHLAM5_04910 [Chlamydiia bacterium]|nr:hypothetical protein [Chlamydiia bacterium]MCH9618362.1 hypothetical protein [Chlamydiia bacterium]MCH9624216.1 hypothetical protein [Chlamydiia bacterium]
MKKLFLLILILLFAAGTLFFFPYLLPQKIQKMAVNHYTKDLPGTITYDSVYITGRTWEPSLYNFTWKYKDIELKLPVIALEGSLWELYNGTSTPIKTFKGKLFYKNKLLLDDIMAKIFFAGKDQTVSLSKESLVHCSIIEGGTKAFLNHGVVPPFSAEKVTLTLKKGSINRENKKIHNLSGSLALGTLDCTENHLLSVILKMLKSQPQARIPVNCGTINFMVDNGIASYRKTPFLVDEEYTVVSKGTVNFNQSTLNISVGLMADSIKKAFDIQYLPDNYIIPFKIDGTISNPKYHTKNALASIAAIILLKKISPETRKFPKSYTF